MNWLFAAGSQSTGASALASVLSMNIQGWFPLELTGLTSLLSNRLSGVFSSTTVQKHQFLGAQPSLWSNSHTCNDYWKTTTLTILTFVGKVMSLLCNMLSRFVIAFLSRNKHLFISWLQSPSTVTLELRKEKLPLFLLYPLLLPWSDGTGRLPR